MEADLKTQLVKSVKNIKNKLKQMRHKDEHYELQHKKIFKSLSDPLETLVSLNNISKNVNANKENIEKCVQNDTPTDDSNLDLEYKPNEFASLEFNTPTKGENYMAKVKSPQANSKYLQLPNEPFNVTFGVRNDGDKLFIGNSPITLKTHGENSPNKITMVNLPDKSYELTPGLRELLFQTKPDSNIVEEKDKLTYKDILIHTNAHKRGYSPNGQIQGNSGLKYCKFIKPLFVESNKKQGGNLPVLKKYKRNTDYIYWDDPNELIDRLKLLVASKNAGNTNHDNEIISIIEELQEAGIIKE